MVSVHTPVVIVKLFVLEVLMSTSKFGSLESFGKELKKINKPITTELPTGKPITTEVPMSRIRSHIKDTDNIDYTRRLPKRIINSDKRWDAFKKWARGYFDTGYSADNEILCDIQDAMSVLEERYP